MFRDFVLLLCCNYLSLGEGTAPQSGSFLMHHADVDAARTEGWKHIEAALRRPEPTS